MPRYFVHIDDGSPMPDREGSEFTGLAEVEVAVRRSMVELMADAALERRDFSIKIEVRDEAGLLVMGGKVDYALSMTLSLAHQGSNSEH